VTCSRHVTKQYKSDTAFACVQQWRTPVSGHCMLSQYLYLPTFTFTFFSTFSIKPEVIAKPSHHVTVVAAVGIRSSERIFIEN